MADYLTSGETFTSSVPGKTVTATRLNNHVRGAKILPAFMDSTTHAAPAALTDLVLTCDAAFAAFNMPTLTQLFAMQVADAAAATASLRTLGNTGTKAAPGASTPGLALANTFTNSNLFRKIGCTPVYGGLNAPTVAAIAAGAGTGGSVGAILTANSTDQYGQIELTTGAVAGGASAIAATLTFGATFAAAPFVFFFPINIAAIAVQQATKACSRSGTTTGKVDLLSGTVALSINTLYVFGYLVLGL